jgi:hypothetical protein
MRSLDNEEERKGKEPKAPVAETEDDETDEFDGASTTNDWRRKSDRDLEIPENVASEPAFSYGRDLSPITFPSERDVPPRRIHVPDEAIEQQAAAKNAAPQSKSASKPEPAPVDDFFKSPVIHAVQPAESNAAPEQASESLTQPAPTPDHVLPARTGGWMDLIASTTSAPEHREKHWMSDARATEDETRKTEAHASAPVSHSIEKSAPHAPEISEPEPPAPETPEVPKVEDQYIEDEQPQKKSWFTDAVEAVREAVSNVVQDAGHDEGTAEVDDAIQEDIHEPAHEPAPMPASSAAPVSSGASVPSAPPAWNAPSAASHEFEQDAAESQSSYRDPALEVPAAAHVTPEPLLVKDEHARPSEYGKRFELPAATHSFIPPPPEEPMTENASANGGSPFFEPAPPEPAFPGFGERIPTAPPPNREALAQIPFLTPPPPSMDSSKVDEGQVDAVVQKVLERLEPQLHDLLSKGLLKPLIENMLQAELTKKEK